MNISETIKRLEEIKVREGDLDLFGASFVEVRSLYVAESKDHDFPDDWNMPKKFIIVGSAD